MNASPLMRLVVPGLLLLTLLSSLAVVYTTHNPGGNLPICNNSIVSETSWSWTGGAYK